MAKKTNAPLSENDQAILSPRKEEEKTRYLFEERSLFIKFKKVFIFVLVVYSSLIYPIEF